MNRLKSFFGSLFRKKGSKSIIKENTMNEEVKKVETETNSDGKTEEVKEEKKVEEKPENKADEKPVPEEKPVPAEEQEQPVVQETPEQGNAIRVEDLITKEEVREMISALKSEINAITNENKDLKEKLGEYQDKYEKGDFGGVTKQGVDANTEGHTESFKDYAKKFM